MKHIGNTVPQNKNKEKQRVRQRFKRTNVNTKRTQQEVRHVHDRRRKMDTEKLSSINNAC